MGLRVLVVEDHLDSLDLLVYLLRSRGHLPFEARRGDQAVQVALEVEPDLILCDLQLPGKSGYDVLAGLKADPRLRRVPVIAVTAFAMAVDRERALKAGFDGFITKPIDPERFVREAEAYLTCGHDPRR